MPIDPLDRILAATQPQKIYETDTVSDPLSQLQADRQRQELQLQKQLEAITRARDTGTEGAETRWGESSESASITPTSHVPSYDPNAQQGSVMGAKTGITQAYGTRNPSIEVFSKDGVNRGVDFGVKENTPLALPPGEWKIVQAFSEAKGRGRIGDSTNSGYGNSVLALNTKTGEMMRFSHLNQVRVREGQVVKGGTIFGLSGATGNVTGPHLDLEYKDPLGQFQDIMRSGYAQYLFNN